MSLDLRYNNGRLTHAGDLKDAGKLNEALRKYEELIYDTTDAELRVFLELNVVSCLLALGDLEGARIRHSRLEFTLKMNAVSSYFLRAKHWQIFLIVFGVYFVGQMAVMSSVLASPRSNELFATGGLTVGFVMALSTLGFFVWFWSMGHFSFRLLSRS